MTEFFMKGTSQDFDSVLKLYLKAVKAKEEQKKKKKGESLQSLDKYEIPSVFIISFWYFVDISQ